jgi:hypothetical protein
MIRFELDLKRCCWDRSSSNPPIRNHMGILSLCAVVQLVSRLSALDFSPMTSATCNSSTIGSQIATQQTKTNY